MAYLAFDETGVSPLPAPVIPAASELPASPDRRLSALEWSVVAIARTDRLSSLRHPGRLATALRTVFKQHNPMLADERLEALRRMAVLSWHYGFTVPSHEVKAFFAAGFSSGQYETMVASIGTARTQREARR